MSISRISISLFLAFFSLLIFGSLAAQDLGNPIVPVVNHSVSQPFISKNGLRAIFSMRLRNWPDNNTPITVFVLPDTDPLHNQFSKETLNVFPGQMRRAWNRLVFSGSGQAPITVANRQEMLERVNSTPGAIGYLPITDIRNDVRILQME